MRVFENLSMEQWAAVLARPSSEDNVIRERVSGIVERVRVDGDTALEELTRVIDFADFCVEGVEVSLGEFEYAQDVVSQELKDALGLAKENIEKFHRAQLRGDVVMETMSGVEVCQRRVAIPRVGLYIPGGTAPLFSTVLMCAVPAYIAGCREIIMCTPMNKQGQIAPEILYAAKLCGVDRVYKLGGAVAVAAMAYGTESVRKVDKIFGPGNRYVTHAKQLVAGRTVAIDMPAGPSEVMVVADASARAEFVAADLLSQLEHGADSQAIAVVTTKELAQNIQTALVAQTEELERGEILEKSLENCTIIVENDLDKVLKIVDQYAPEHLIISTENADEFALKVTNAGSIFIGNYSPESVGDYASGTNHTLPTAGWATSFSGVNLDSFSKYITYQKLSEKGLQSLSKCVITMAEGEGLTAHANAVKIRLSNNGIK